MASLQATIGLQKKDRMANDIITLALSGDVPLGTFDTAVRHFTALVNAITSDLAIPDIEWGISALETGSAIISIRGESNDIAGIEKAVRAYSSVGKALEEQRPVPYSERIAREAIAIAGVISERVPYVRFETLESDATIYSKTPQNVVSPIVISTGAIEGKIQTLTNRKGLRFTLFDTLHDKAVSCYLQEGQEDLMRQSWGKRSIISGKISRERFSGRPVSIRDISNVELLPESAPGSYLKARGIVPRLPNSPRPEEVIRRLRDA
jgi:hypothetical protein